MKRYNDRRPAHPPINEAGPNAEEQKAIYRRTWRNWFFLSGVLILTTIGLASASPPLLSERITRFWPWGKTDFVLLAGLSLTVLAFIGYLTQQQRVVLLVHERLQRLREEYNLKIESHTARLYALSSISHIMGVETDPESIFRSITRICAETFDCHRASLMLLDEEHNELVVRSVCGQSDVNILDKHQKVGEGIAGWAALHRTSLLLGGTDDYDKLPELKFTNRSLTSTMVVPIFVRDELVGVINVASKSLDTAYDANDLHALQIFAENAGICIRHTEQIRWLRRMNPNLDHEPQRGIAENRPAKP
jgi:transcriptional regulator with GAF, ATPase, and Fis domain